MISRFAAVSALAFATLAPAAAQTERHPELGMTLVRPSDYEALPVRPRERFCVLAYIEKPGAGRVGAARPTLAVYVVPHSGGADETVVDAATFLQLEVGATKTQELHPGKSRYGYQPRRWAASARSERGQPEGVYVHAWEGADRTIVLEGRCEPAAFAAEQRVWERVADGMRLFEPLDLDAEREKLQRYYGQRNFHGVDYRIDVRLSMVDGWKARDSEHFIVLSHDVSERFVREVIDNVEAIRREYGKLCPPDRNLDAVSTMRICRDQQEYLAYGGWEGSVGYWSSGEEELVLFDGTNAVEPGVDGKHLTLSVVYHEAFHQFVHYSADEMPPHTWFDEGMAEYFAGGHVASGRFRDVEVNRYRLEKIQSSLKAGDAYPWEVVTKLNRDEFYADPQVLYAQAWSMVHFLVESGDARRNASWNRILPTYFRTLRTAWTAERRRIGASQGGWDAARERAQQKALRAAFKNVDWPVLQQAWAEYVMALDMPEAR